MPENFRAKHSENNGFWFWKKYSSQNKQRKNTLCPAKDIISQANDVVNKCIMQTVTDRENEYYSHSKKVHGIIFMAISATVLGVLIYYLICWLYAIPKKQKKKIGQNFGIRLKVQKSIHPFFFFCWLFLITELYFK